MLQVLAPTPRPGVLGGSGPPKTSSNVFQVGTELDAEWMCCAAMVSVISAAGPASVEIAAPWNGSAINFESKTMDEATKQGLDVALNEATLIGIEVDRDRRCAAITLAVLTLPEGNGPPPHDRRVSMVLSGVGRVAASLRLGNWDDEAAEVQPFALDDLLEVVRSFGGQDIYGWEFLDYDKHFERWSDRLSLDEHLGTEKRVHSITLFQEGAGDRHLDVRIWFDELRIFEPDGSEIAMNDFIAGGKRWWDAFFAGDKRTLGLGLYPS